MSVLLCYYFYFHLVWSLLLSLCCLTLLPVVVFPPHVARWPHWLCWPHCRSWLHLVLCSLSHLPVIVLLPYMVYWLHWHHGLLCLFWLLGFGLSGCQGFVCLFTCQASRAVQTMCSNKYQYYLQCCSSPSMGYHVPTSVQTSCSIQCQYYHQCCPSSTSVWCPWPSSYLD